MTPCTCDANPDSVITCERHGTSSKTAAISRTSTFCIHLKPRTECDNPACNPAIRPPTKQIADAIEAARQFIRYYTESAFADEEERKAKEASDGNIQAIEVIVSRLRTEMERLIMNPGSMRVE